MPETPITDPKVSIPLSLLTGLVTATQHALDGKAASDAALTQEDADKASLQAKLDGVNTDLDTVKLQLDELKANQDVPLSDDLHAQIDKLVATPAPAVAPAAPALVTPDPAVPASGVIPSPVTPAVTEPVPASEDAFTASDDHPMSAALKSDPPVNPVQTPTIVPARLPDDSAKAIEKDGEDNDKPSPAVIEASEHVEATHEQPVS